MTHRTHTLTLADVDPQDARPEAWWGCDHPERPRDNDTLYDWECDGCFLALSAAVAQPGVANDHGTMNAEGQRTRLPLSDLLANMRDYRSSRQSAAGRGAQ